VSDLLQVGEGGKGFEAASPVTESHRWPDTPTPFSSAFVRSCSIDSTPISPAAARKR
jgi:hypothetical protein